MYLNLIFLFFILVLPFIIWRRNGQQSELFLSAALAWSCYGAWICLSYGLTATFEVGGSSVTLNNWHSQILIFGYFISAYAILKIFDLIRLSVNRTAMDIVFWGFAISIFCMFALEEIFTRHQYPPVWKVLLTDQQHVMLSIAAYYTNAVSASSVLLFIAIVLTAAIKRVLATASRAVRYIRNL